MYLFQAINFKFNTLLADNQRLSTELQSHYRIRESRNPIRLYGCVPGIWHGVDGGTCTPGGAEATIKIR